MDDTRDHAPEVTEEQEVFHLNGITYLPHYTMPGRFVAPGDGKRRRPYYREELIAAGATPGVEFLWPRVKPKQRQAA